MAKLLVFNKKSRRIHYNMQNILKNKNERSYCGETDLMGSVICVGRISRCMERKYIRRFGNRRNRVWISGRILVRVKKEFGGGDEELRKVEQEERTMKEFVINETIRKKLIKAKKPLTNIKQ